jgi:hypothetical protein
MATGLLRRKSTVYGTASCEVYFNVTLYGNHCNLSSALCLMTWYVTNTSDSSMSGFFFSGVGLTSPGTAATCGLLYSPR